MKVIPAPVPADEALTGKPLRIDDFVAVSKFSILNPEMVLSGKLVTGGSAPKPNKAPWDAAEAAALTVTAEKVALRIELPAYVSPTREQLRAEYQAGAIDVLRRLDQPADV